MAFRLLQNTIDIIYYTIIKYDIHSNFKDFKKKNFDNTIGIIFIHVLFMVGIF